MLQFETKIRVRYGETDKMGFVYYGNYPLYYEIGRTELMRNFGLTYREMEENGILLPVASLHVKYIKPAFYDDVLRIKTMVKTKPAIRICFDYEVYNQTDELINKGDTTLVFISNETMRPKQCPAVFLQKINQYFT